MSSKRQYASVAEMQQALLNEEWNEAQRNPLWNSFCKVLDESGLKELSPGDQGDASDERFALLCWEFFLAARGATP